MSEDIIKPRGASASFKDDRGGAVLLPSAVLGIVKNNIDPTRSGKIQVYLKRLGSSDQDTPSNWATVSYLSPFFGSTPNTGSPDAHGDYVGNPNSYGFWATPPDIDTEVVCVFLNGDPNFGYYIGSIPKPGLTHMVPGIAASDSVIPNSGEASSYGGATRLPVSEINNANKKQDNNAVLTYQPRPIHSYQAGIYFKQGLLRDPDRGPISSSSQRESPSRVFGMSTPGRPIYQGGYDDKSIGNAVKDESIPDKNFQVIGRRGGHSFVMDDGDLTGKDQLVRLRTSTGHQILMNDSAETLFIIHANGQSYIELGKSGTIDMYSTNSVNIRTQGDLNLHADNNININAKKDLNIAAENIRMESSKETSNFVGTAFKNHTKGDYTVKADGGAAIAASGAASLSSAGTVYVNGPSAVNLNTGSSPLKPEAVKQLPIVSHPDTLRDESKGYADAPGKLQSITSRAPAHTPWSNANKGVDVKTDLSASANFPSPPSPATTEVNKAVPASPPAPTTPALAATVPAVKAASPTLDKVATSTLVSQMAVNAATGPMKTAVQNTAGITNTMNGMKTASLGVMGFNPAQMVETGHLKPGSDVAINAAIQSGKTLEQALSPNFFTGKDGVANANQFVKRVDVQTSAASTLLQKGEVAMKDMGLISGKESPTQTGGFILSAATVGAGATAAFAKSVMSGTGLSSAASGLGLDPNKILNPLGGNISNLMASGKSAANLADKSLSGFSLSSISDKLTGAAAGAFASITAAFKPMKAGVPQNLTALKAEAKSEEEKVSGATSSLTTPAEASALTKVASSEASSTSSLMSSISKQASSLTDKVTSSLGKTATKLVDSKIAEINAKVPGAALLTGAIKNITGSTNGTLNSLSSSLAGLKNKLTGGGGIQALASNGLGLKDTSKLNSAIASVGTGGPVDIKLPTVSSGGFDTTSLAAQSASLLGNPKIPPISFGDNQPTNTEPEVSKGFENYREAVLLADDKRQIYYDLRKKKGESDPATIAAYNDYKSLQQKADELEKLA